MGIAASADFRKGRFPERSHLMETEAPLLDEVVRSLGSAPAGNNG